MPHGWCRMSGRRHCDRDRRPDPSPSHDPGSVPAQMPGSAQTHPRIMEACWEHYVLTWHRAASSLPARALPSAPRGIDLKGTRGHSVGSRQVPEPEGPVHATHHSQPVDLSGGHGPGGPHRGAPASPLRQRTVLGLGGGGVDAPRRHAFPDSRGAGVRGRRPGGSGGVAGGPGWARRSGYRDRRRTDGLRPCGSWSGWPLWPRGRCRA